MARVSKMIEIHEHARSYRRVKSKHVVESLYTDFVPWHDLPDFSNKIKTPSGSTIEYADDPSVIVGTATFKGTNTKVAIIAQQTPSNDMERTKFNYGLVKADGYGLSLSMMNYAEKNGLMLHTFVDTIGGDPFEYSAEKLQSWLISYCQAKMMTLNTKSISVILGSGGSGGAIAIQLAHRRFMLSHAEYSVITAEGCSAILFRNASNIEEALKVLQPTWDYMVKYGIVDKVIKEPSLDSPDYLPRVLDNVQKVLSQATDELERSDIHYLQKSLRERIEECGQLEERPRRYQAFAKKLKLWLPSYPFKKKTVTPEVSQMQLALYGAEPYVCNDEKDPEGKVIRFGCRNRSTEKEFQENYYSCPYCQKPSTLGSDHYLNLLLDNGSFHELHPEISTENIDRRFNFYDYSDSLAKVSNRTDSNEALIIGYGTVFDIPVAIAVSDFRFMGGSMGAIFGEKMKLLVDYAIRRKLPLISVSATGGARMQEGTIALYQMAKTISAVLRLKEAGLPYISILGHPTTGGALASYTVQGDFIIAEKKATLAFAGDRVVKLTSGGRGVDPNVMTAEFYAKHGGIHLVTERGQLKSLIAGLLGFPPWNKRLRKHTNSENGH
ncbi:MAG TPA: carboxyl transferase domain-containing protein [Thermodesulfobacteriota bacterium]|nr:carboxyl transferase domain-containing protein [Thermodesulfobacteriota bacterium]